MQYLSSMTLTDPSYRARVKRQTDSPVFEFTNRITLLVGPNGCGKSSLLDAINKEYQDRQTKVGRMVWDSSVPIVGYSGEQATILLADQSLGNNALMGGRRESHGQGLSRYLQGISALNGDHIILLDEPETALDFFGVDDLCRMIAQRANTQFVIATHHPLMFLFKTAGVIELGDQPDAKGYRKSVLKRLQTRLAQI